MIRTIRHCALAQFTGPRPPTQEDKEKARLRIGITKEQQVQIEAIFTDTDKQMREIMGKLRDLSQQLYGELDNYDYDRNRVRSLQKNIMQQSWRMMRLRSDNEEKFR